MIKQSLLLVILLGLGCSAPVKRPTIAKAKGASANVEIPNPNSGNGLPVDREGVPPGENQNQGQGENQIPKAAKGVTEEIVAGSGESCAAPKEAKSLAARSILRLLTREEYKNSIDSLLALGRNFSESLPPERKALGFSNNAAANTIGDRQMLDYINTARDIAKTALSKDGRLPCRDGANCAERIINEFAPLAWRRPLAAEEKMRLSKLSQVAAADGNAIVLEVLLTGIFSSPNFLYRSEIGKDGKLTAHEAASALAYFFWAAPPDEALRKAAGDGSILDAKVLSEQAQRLMSDARAKSGVAAFSEAYLEYSHVLGVNKNQDKFKDYDDAMRNAAYAEARDSFDYWLRAKNLKFPELFAAQTTVGDEGLARFYGGTLMQDGDTKVIDYSSGKRRGILGLSAILAQLATADETHPIRRGLYVREQLLCEAIDPTPEGIVVAFPPVKAGLTTRERFAAHTANTACASCHKLLDGVGFGMEDYDAVGQLREMDDGLPLDSTGEIVALDGKDQKFSGVGGINEILKNSDRAKRCFVLQVFRQAAGRFETAADVCDIRSVANDFISNNRPLSEVFLRMISSPAYLERGQ